ncbi:MAG: DUF5060 domain-containing protein, partial [Verrucomicrobia bacterium]|nr:DUF5060 domain-containing protein [Verrucomicrobiota bacterium]
MHPLPVCYALLALPLLAASSDPIIPADLIFEERNGVLAVEAEHFIKQEKHEVRAWYIISTASAPDIKPDGDPSHANTASGGAYLECLPDTRRTHDDKLTAGENFSNTPGGMAVLSYKVHINTPGKYYVWVRTHSTGTEDNGIHVGLDGTWPESGARMQWTTKNTWHWDSKQRTEKQHGGVEGLIWLQIDQPGEHTIQFSMREDGFEFDKFLLTTTAPPASRPDGTGPPPRVKDGKLPDAFPVAEKALASKYPAHWGQPPAIQTTDIVPLPGGYGQGSSSLRGWIQQNLDKDAANRKGAATPKYPAHWGNPPRIQTRDYVKLPGGYGHGSSTLKKWIQENLDKDAGKKDGAQRERENPAEDLVARKLDPMRLGMSASQFLEGSKGYYLDQGKWLAVNPAKDKSGTASAGFNLPTGKYDLILRAVGESDGQSTYTVQINDGQIGAFICPLSEETYEEGEKFSKRWPNIDIARGDVLKVTSNVASTVGKEFSRARWAGLSFAAADAPTEKALAEHVSEIVKKIGIPYANKSPGLQQPRGKDGNGKITISGELKQWHKVTLTLDGPFAHEQDNRPNPFTDYALSVTFTHESGSPSYTVPGYFAADGNAAESSAQSGTKWRTHLSPDKPGQWTYRVSFLTAPNIISGETDAVGRIQPLHKKTGSFTIDPTDKSGRDFRAQGRLIYVGKHHLRFAGSKEYFLKAGADAPETLLGYADFDGTSANKAAKVPLKHYKPHLADWKAGDPSWQDGKGKGLIGALNYLSSTGANAFSFLPYNAGGDGDNVWPFTSRDDPLHYDCSKL